MLPNTIEAGFRGGYNYFNSSSIRQLDLLAFQEFVHCEKHIIVAPGKTKWLSLEACITRVVEQLLRFVYISIWYKPKSYKQPSFPALLQGLKLGESHLWVIAR